MAAGRAPIETPDGTAYVDPDEVVYVSPSTAALNPHKEGVQIRVRVCFLRGGGMFNILDTSAARRVLGLPEG